MKKATLLFSFIAFTIFAHAQVAINTNGGNPAASAMLDISSSDKGLLIPRVSLINTIGNTTVPNPATSLLVYNINAGMGKGVGYYYNNGTPAAPNWQPMQDLVLPFTKSTSASGSAFTIENYSPNISSTAIKAVAGGNGNALEVQGKMKIAGNGQTPTQGKVLTSDANGNATWEGAVAFSARGVVNTGSHIIATGVNTKLRFASVKYDLSGAYSGPNAANHSVFTTPVHGIYHFDIVVDWDIPTDGTGYMEVMLVSIKNAAKRTLVYQTQNPAGQSNIPFVVTTDFELQAGEQVFVEVAHHNIDNYLKITPNESVTFFNGRLVTKL